MSLYGNELNVMNEAGKIKGIMEKIFGPSIPLELKINDTDLVTPSSFKKKNEKIKKIYEEKGLENKLSEYYKALYYGIFGNTFFNDHKYVSILPIIVPDIKKYCSEKDKKLIQKNIDKTIETLEKKDELNEKQKAWLKDIKKVKLI